MLQSLFLEFRQVIVFISIQEFYHELLTIELELLTKRIFKRGALLLVWDSSAAKSWYVDLITIVVKNYAATFSRAIHWWIGNTAKIWLL